MSLPSFLPISPSRRTSELSLLLLLACPHSHKCRIMQPSDFLHVGNDTHPRPPSASQISFRLLSSSHHLSSNKPWGPTVGGLREVTVDFIKTWVSINLQSESHWERAGWRRGNVSDRGMIEKGWAREGEGGGGSKGENGMERFDEQKKRMKLKRTKREG